MSEESTGRDEGKKVQITARVSAILRQHINSYYRNRARRLKAKVGEKRGPAEALGNVMAWLASHEDQELIQREGAKWARKIPLLPEDHVGETPALPYGPRTESVFAEPLVAKGRKGVRGRSDGGAKVMRPGGSDIVRDKDARRDLEAYGHDEAPPTRHVPPVL